jgi:hypothetical protein
LQKLYICLGKEKVVYAKIEEGEEIKMGHDERKKVFLDQSQWEFHGLFSNTFIFFETV